MDRNNLYIKHVKQFSLLVDILNNFFNDKKYNNKKFLNELKNDIFNKTSIKFSNKKIYNLLIHYHKYGSYIEKVKNLKLKFNNEIIQSGGFFSRGYDNKYTKALNVIDFLIDIINLIPNKIISKNYSNVTLPYAIMSFVLNILRSDYDFAFYSFIGMIPGVGSILSASSKIVHRIVRNIAYQNEENKKKNHYKEIQTTRKVHDYLKNQKFHDIENPFNTKFENEYIV